MRAWCTRIKKKVITDYLDPERPQTYKVVQSERCPVGNASTWLRWWSGDAVPRPSHVRAVERLSPGSSRLLDLSEMGTAQLRHLVALDILNTRFRTKGRPTEFQHTQCQRLLTALNHAWSPFLAVRPLASTSRFALEKQLGGERAARMFYKVSLTAAEHARIQDGGNLRRAALPRDAILEHNWLEPISIFRFLGSLPVFNELDNVALLKMWAYDYASAAMVVRTQLERAPPREASVVQMGKAGIMYAIAHHTFWASAHADWKTQVRDLVRLLFPDNVALACDRLNGAQASYYEGFKTWGIPEKTVRALNSEHKSKTWDGAFSAARERI